VDFYIDILMRIIHRMFDIEVEIVKLRRVFDINFEFGDILVSPLLIGEIDFFLEEVVGAAA